LRCYAGPAAKNCKCENCAIALTHHKPIIPGETIRRIQPGQRLKCHYWRIREDRCPNVALNARASTLFYLGAGSQQGEERSPRSCFRHARIGRMDRDTIRNRFDMEHLLTRLHSGQIKPAGGHADDRQGSRYPWRDFCRSGGSPIMRSGLRIFRAAERVFQLLTQVSGRAGGAICRQRSWSKAYYPEHYAIQCAAAP